MAVTRKATVPNPGVVRVNPKKGEYLHFRLEAAGPVTIFAFSSSVTGTLRKAPDFPGHPKKLYEWEHLKNPSEIQHRELLDLLMAFTTSAAYKLVRWEGARAMFQQPLPGAAPYTRLTQDSSPSL